MHRALLVFEILLEIFAYLNETPNPFSDRTTRMLVAKKTLAALARTCKTFHEPAMDELWADIDGLEPLLGCVTRLYPVIYPHTKMYYFRGSSSQGVEPLSEHEARQFLRHSTRVRSLKISSDKHFHLLSVIPIDGCIFPNLQSLIWKSLTRRYLDLFLSHTLRRCYLLVINEVLKCIATRCAALEALSIDCGRITADELSLLTDSVRLCKRLATLSCPALGWAAWEHLSNLPTLITVAINEGRVPPPLDLNIIKLAPFLNLTTLSFFVETAETITTLVQHSEFPSLKYFMMVVGALPWIEAERLFRALSQCKSCSTLEHIFIDSKRPGIQEPSGNSLTAVAQFLCFKQLRMLYLHCHYPVLLDNDLLLEAMSSWPHIRSLTLHETRCRPGTVTFRGLFAALRQCPHLQNLHIPLDAVNIDIDPTAESFQHTTLRKLGLGTASHIADAEAVAGIIFFMLPCVDQVLGPKPEWQKVNKHLEHLISSSVPGRHIARAPWRYESE